MHLLSLVVYLTMAGVANTRYIMYLTGQHSVVPELSLVSEITHVALAFMRPGIFNQAEPSSWPLFTTVETVRSKFSTGTAVMVAIGGWGDTEAFSYAAKTESGRKLFARNIKAMVEAIGADGVDIDWEYPGGNAEDYKKIPNSQKTWEITAYPLLLSEIRSALGPDKLISAAVPGLPRDMLAFTHATIPQISASLDFFNVMTYDLLNRRDNVTKHHTGITASLTALNIYERYGVPRAKMNLGFAFYIKWCKTAPFPEARSSCAANPIGCPTALMEDPITGADLGRAGGFSWHDAVPMDVSASYKRAMERGIYDEEGGGHYYWDEEEDRWWTWDTPEAIEKKVRKIVGKENRGLGGVFAWGLGEDAERWVHLKALTRALEKERKLERGLEGRGETYLGVEVWAYMGLPFEDEL